MQKVQKKNEENVADLGTKPLSKAVIDAKDLRTQPSGPNTASRWDMSTWTNELVCGVAMLWAFGLIQTFVMGVRAVRAARSQKAMSRIVRAESAAEMVAAAAAAAIGAGDQRRSSARTLVDSRRRTSLRTTARPVSQQ